MKVLFFVLVVGCCAVGAQAATPGAAELRAFAGLEGVQEKRANATPPALTPRELATVEVSTFAELQAAVANAPTTGELTMIEVGTNLDFSAATGDSIVTVDGGRNVKIQGKVGARRVLDAKASNSDRRRYFHIASGSELALDNLELKDGYASVRTVFARVLHFY